MWATCPQRRDATSGGAAPLRWGPHLEKSTAVRLPQVTFSVSPEIGALDVKTECGHCSITFCKPLHTAPGNSWSDSCWPLFLGKPARASSASLAAGSLEATWCSACPSLSLHSRCHIPSASISAGLGSLPGGMAQTPLSKAGNPSYLLISGCDSWVMSIYHQDRAGQYQESFAGHQCANLVFCPPSAKGRPSWRSGTVNPCWYDESFSCQLNS